LPDGSSCDIWWFAAAEPRGRVLVCHGYFADRAQVWDVAAGLSARGFESLVMELRGHGERPGPCTLGVREADDADAILRWAWAQDGPSRLPTAVLGFSMGAAVVMRLAERLPGILAVVADSAYPRLFPVVCTVIRQRYHLPPVPFAWISWWAAQLALRTRLAPLDPLAIAGRLPQPLLAIQGGADQRVGALEQEALFTRWAGPKERWVEPDAGHVAIVARDPSAYCDRVAAFLDRTLAGGRG
jgi:alpha-beta hydrolase superfamily lysophospholipase